MSNTIYKLKHVIRQHEPLRALRRKARSEKYQKEILNSQGSRELDALVSEVLTTLRSRGGCEMLALSLKDFCNNVRPLVARNGNFLGAVRYLCEPERLDAFDVVWTNRYGEKIVNKGWRCNYNGVLGVCRGGVRFHPSVSEDVIVALAFEVTLQNALTNLPMGGCFMGSDFDSRNSCDADVQSFCNSFVVEVRRRLPANWPFDITCDLGCGPRECRMLMAANRGVINTATEKPYPTIIGKPHAAGLGAVEFGKLFCRIPSFDKTRCLVSGSGDCALIVARNLIAEGAVVLTMSDSCGYIYAAEGLNYLQWQKINEHRQYRIPLRDIVSEDVALQDVVWRAGTVWEEALRAQSLRADYAFPCAHELEIDIGEAENLHKLGKIKALVEVSYLACSPDAQTYFLNANVQVAPAKACNTGAMIALGMHLAESMEKAEFENEIKSFMNYIYDQCRSVYSSYYPDIYFREATDICALLALTKAMKQKQLL